MIHKTKPIPHVLLLEIDNPPVNSLSKAMKRQFNQFLDEIEQAISLRALVITGRGTKFCTGDDLKEAAQNAARGQDIVENLKVFGNLMNRIEQLPIPVIAAINGWCIGGGLELALCCDIRIAVDTAKFITAGVNVGLVASANRLPRLVGVGRAKHLLLTGTSIDAPKAELFGLVTGLYPKNQLLPAALQLAQLIATKAPLAIKATKQIANQAMDLPAIENQVLEQQALLALAQSADHHEALFAFSGKRKPCFLGK